MAAGRAGDGSAVLMLSPYLPYSGPLVEAFAVLGLGTVALYTDLPALRHFRTVAPLPGGPSIVASYVADERDLDLVAGVLRDRHHVVGVCPVFETDLLPLARIADLLGVSSVDPDVIARFRDKAALKEHLRSVSGGPCVNVTCEVSSGDDVREVVAEHGLDRFVLKPNDGFGNRAIFYGDAATSHAAVDAYLASASGRVLLEEYVGGTEYYVNGQVDERGVAHVFSVNQYVRADLHGRQDVFIGDFTVRTDRPEFAVAADYARTVIAATGLVRSPFHLELKIDDRGPCLLEVAARFCGANVAFRDADGHGGLDVFGIAAHHVVSPEPYGEYPLDWTTYDASVRGLVYGISHHDELVHDVAGMHEVESLREFERWETKPEVGTRVVRSVDLLRPPWSATTTTQTEDDYHRVADRMRALVRINPPSTRTRTLALTAAAYVPPVVRAVRGRLPGPPRLERIGRGPR
jgi:hypothetical protein